MDIKYYPFPSKSLFEMALKIPYNSYSICTTCCYAKTNAFFVNIYLPSPLKNIEILLIFIEVLPLRQEIEEFTTCAVFQTEIQFLVTLEGVFHFNNERMV